ncbi:glutathione S-transferase [Melanomma pulvis-pyrius CBS 109.77]|uniref:Glutathione S-transferase n=1 Tax=Melanomma pulvis-pyrius CBS 109.77 TaxID=1314802 RepID=A0A6A6XC82_9PLEO|nr:glutathione S-transferase [Melanomma pulvis-pyrius CBS 109.77]
MSTTTTPLKPITLWGAGGPNPPKVAILLIELGLPHEIKPITLAEVKQPPYTTEINPNGRMPSIQDPNTSLTLWESGAIIEYLVERYDVDRKLSFAPGTKEAWLARQWLYFQASGQGPYYGQAGWFMMYHAEKIPSAIARYIAEINRVTGVLETHLKKRKEEGDAGADGPWLVGDKCSYVDLAWVTWQSLVSKMVAKEDFDPEAYPEVTAWLARLNAREAVKSVLSKAMKAK